MRSPQVHTVLPEDLHGVVIEITEQEEVLQDDNLQQSLAPLRARGPASPWTMRGPATPVFSR